MSLLNGSTFPETEEALRALYKIESAFKGYEKELQETQDKVTELERENEALRNQHEEHQQAIKDLEYENAQYYRTIKDLEESVSFWKSEFERLDANDFDTNP